MEWLNVVSAFHFRWTHLGGKIVCSVEDDAQRKEIENLEWIDDRGVPLHVFLREDDAVVMTVLELFRWLYVSKNGVMPEVGTEDCAEDRWIDIDLNSSTVSILTHKSRFKVTKVNLGFVISNKNISLESIEQYQAGDKNLAHHLLWKHDIEHQGESLPLEIEVTLNSK